MKYKLIKEYPGSPKLGNTIDNLENDWIENYSEFWQPVVEKDYEILSFYNKEGKSYYNVITQGYYYSEPASSRSLTYCLLYYKIHSIKRLSDGEIFTVGDKITSSSFTRLTDIDEIKEFYIPDEKFCKMWSNQFTINDLIIRTSESWQSNLHHTIKPKQPLFTTEDGVDIFAGMSFYYVCEELELYNTVCCTDEKKYKNQKQFSTKEKAEEYIIMNKPCLSYNDVLNTVSIKNKNTFNTLKDLARLKITFSSNVQNPYL